MTINTTNNFVVITAEKGKVFRSKVTGDILSKQLFLGCYDKAENYEEINKEDAYVSEEEKEIDKVQNQEANGIQ